MEQEGKRRLAGSFHGTVRIHRSLDMRYGEQIFEINVPLEGLDLASPGRDAEGGRAIPPAA
jgi:N-methylhydantoinase A